jgi:peptidoglycan hydrolase-like protein with peptidoglycan-binding domain
MGAYDFGFYKSGMVGDGGGRKSQAIFAIKRELVANGLGADIDMSVDKFGGAVAEAVKTFQTSRGLKADGVCGPTTMKELFRGRVEAAEKKYNLEKDDLVKQLWLESLFDPVAVGVADPGDRGMGQIHLDFFPNITEAQAFDPAFAIDWSASYIASQRAAIIQQANVYKAARAAYNVGWFYATQWMLAGFPPSGGPLLGGADVFERATKYLALIDKQAP